MNSPVRKGPPKVSGLVSQFKSRDPARLLEPMPELPLSSSEATPQQQPSEDTQQQPSDLYPTPGIPFQVDLSLLDDSPYQHRRSYNAADLEELGVTLQKVGQTDAIKIRRKSSGRFELLSGHRRTRSARLIKWTHLLAIEVSDIDELTAAVQLIVANEQHLNVGDYERACGYQSLLSLGLDQKGISEYVGVSKQMISLRLTFFKLPPDLLAVLDNYPKAMGVRNLPRLRQILDTDPGMILLCIEGLKKVGEGLWTQEVYISTLLQRQKAIGSKQNRSPLTITDQHSKVFATIRTNPGSSRLVEIKVGDGLDCDLFLQGLSNYLVDMAKTNDYKTKAIGNQPSPDADNSPAH